MRTPFALLSLVLTVTALPPATAAEPTPASETPPFASEVESLLAKSQDPDIRVVVHATQRLRDLGPAAVPALMQGLWSDSSTTRRETMDILRMLSADARTAAPSLIRLLGDDNKDVRREAARTLASIGAYSAIPALTKALNDESVAVRLVACESLIILGEKAEIVLPVLTKSLQSQRPEEQEFAARLLADLGPEAAPATLALQRALNEADPALVSQIVESLGRLGPAAKDAVPALKKKVKDDQTAALFRVPVAIALWRINRDPAAVELLIEAVEAKKKSSPLPYIPLLRIDSSKESVDALVKQLKSDDPSNVLAVAESLGSRSKDVVPSLIELMKKETTKNIKTLHATVILGRLGPAAKEALPLLDAIAKAKGEYGSFDAAVAVYQIDPKPDNALAIVEYFEDKDRRLWAAQTLKQLRPNAKAVAVELLVALDSTDDAFRLAAAGALWRIEKNPSALKAAVKSLRSPDPKIRAQAAAELGMDFGPAAKDAIPDLVKRLFDSHAAVRSATAEAIGRVGPSTKDATPALLTLLEGDEPDFVQSAACEALGLIEPVDKDVVAALLRRKLEHPAPLVRVHAALALARVAGDKSGEEEARRGLNYRTHYVRITAAEALWLMNKDERSVPLLVRALEESNLTGQESDNELYMAARALGRIGADAKAAVAGLVKLLDARDPDLAATVATALKAIDPEAAKKAGVK